MRIAIVSGGVACLAGAVAVTLALRMLWRYHARTRPPDPLPPGPVPPGPVSPGSGDREPSVTG